MLLEGCLEKGKCSTAGGARYNFSGIQCVAPVDTGDALFAVEKLVYRERKLTAGELLRHLKKNLPDEKIRNILRKAEKYGNDCEDADRHVARVISVFADLLQSLGKNTRGGAYVMGLYSVTAHEYFGRITGALPNGRRKGESFASGIAPETAWTGLDPRPCLTPCTGLSAHARQTALI